MTSRALYPLGSWLTWALLVPLALLGAGFVTVVMTDIDDLVFDNPQLWWLGGAGPAVGLLVLYGMSRRRRALDRFTSPQLAPLLAARISPGRQAFRAALPATAVLMIAAALIGPRWGLYWEKQTVHGVDIVVAIDVSRSMLADDVEPNRLERAKREIRQQLVERPVFQRANRLALMAFAGSTSLKIPLSTDHLAFLSKLEAIHVGSAPRGGTAIGQAIQKATDLFARSPQEVQSGLPSTKMILLLTDGEDHEGGPVEAAQAAFEEHGIRVFTVGVGDAARTVGARVPAGKGNRPLLHDGQIVFSKLDVEGLRKIAVAAGGQYAPIRDFHRLVNAMAGLKKTELTTEERLRHRPRYQWFLTMALILLGLETIISDRRASVENLPRRVWQQEFE